MATVPTVIPIATAPTGSGGDGDEPVPARFSEDALAATFTERHAERWRYVAAWGQWLTWTGRALAARDDAASLRSLAANLPGRRRSLRKPEAQVEAVFRRRRSRRSSGLRARDRRHAATTDIWDRDPWLLNTPAGVVDLRSGATAAHDPALAMTKIAQAAPQGDCPVWKEFLATVTGGDAELQAYLQRVAGYCLTGVTTEHALFFLYGTGANGKSVFANTLTAIMGDYATVAAMDMFMATHGERHPTDMAGLRGARIVTSIETEQGSRWAESKLKALTGGDKITARFMRQDFFEFIPQFKLLVVGNHKPAIRNVDEAMRRRLHMVPFTVTIPPGKRDKRLPTGCSPSGMAFSPGPSRAASNGSAPGCARRRPSWTRPRTTSRPRTRSGAGSMSAASSAPSFMEPSTALFADWKGWADANGEFVGSIKRFAETLVGKGFERWNTNKSRGFRGLSLRQNSTNTTSMEF